VENSGLTVHDADGHPVGEKEPEAHQHIFDTYPVDDQPAGVEAKQIEDGGNRCPHDGHDDQHVPPVV